MEEWKDVKGYEGFYQVSNTGAVRSVDRYVETSIRYNKKRLLKGKVLKPHKRRTGYYSVDLCRYGVIKEESLHRIVAEAFIPNPDGKKVVNHKDGDKTNNSVENLEWVTYKENHWHARETNLLVGIGQHNNKVIRCVETGTEYKNSVSAAEWLIESNNINIKTAQKKTIAKNIRGCVTGRTPKAYGYHWESI